MSEIYPFMDPELIEIEPEQTPICSEFAYDFSTRQFKHEEGKMFLVYEKEALKIKIWKLFMTSRLRYAIFPNVYGNDLETLIGRAYTQGYINSEAERFVKEAIRLNLSNWIERIEDLKITFNDGTLEIFFRVISIYGTFEMDGLEVIF